MEKPSSVKSALIFFVFLLTIAINLEDNVLARLGFDANYLMMALVAVVFTGLLAHRSVLLIILVLFLSIGANMPVGFMLNFGIDRDYLTGVLVAVVIAPLLARLFDI